jgi:hypothetical protein
MFRTLAKQIWKLHVEDQPSGRAKPYMEITCSGRATIQTIVPHHPDTALKQERFSTKNLRIFCLKVVRPAAQVHRPDGVRTYHSSRPFEPSAYK